MEILRVFTLCSGYDSQCMALDRLGIDYELIGWSEIDKYAIQAHNAVYPEYADRNYGDMTKIDWSVVPDFDFLTYSTPCQSVSQAGLQHGFTEGSGTRSSIIWYVRECIKIKRPRYMMLENVSSMVSKKFISMFNLWQREVESYGYTNYSKILNAKDYGVPQNRERIFMISKFNDEPFYFPKPMVLDKRLKDILDDNVDDGYYIQSKGYETFFKGFNIMSDTHKESKVIGIGRLNSSQDGLVVSPFGISPTHTSGHGNTPKIMQINMDKSSGGKQPYQQYRVFDVNGIKDTLGTTNVGNVIESNRIRKLTERECFRLMGVCDADIAKIQGTGMSKTQQYKMAGNSIVVDVMAAIFNKLFMNKSLDIGQLSIF